jgi:membrane fusion protein
VDAAILDALNRQKAMLVEQIDAQEERTRADRSRLEAVLANVGSEILLLEAQAAIQRERIAVASSLLSSLRQLRDKGHAPDAEYKRRHQELLDHRRELASLEQQAISLRTQAVELRHEMDRLPASAAERLLDMRTRLADTERLVAEAEGRRAYVVRSPLSGRVSALQSVVGRAVDPAQVQMSILPDGSALQAQLFVPSRAIGFVREGQEVRLLYDAFPYQRFGAHRGRIVRVSRTALTQADTSGPISLAEASYRVTVALAAQEIDALGMKHPLQADMRVVADIILDRRSLIAWLLNPLLSTRN